MAEILVQTKPEMKIKAHFLHVYMIIDVYKKNNNKITALKLNIAGLDLNLDINLLIIFSLALKTVEKAYK